MREFIVGFETETPLSELTAGTTIRAIIKTTGDCDELIRCKDCKYWNGNGKYCDYEMSGLENDYCSWAEREE